MRLPRSIAGPSSVTSEELTRVRLLDRPPSGAFDRRSSKRNIRAMRPELQRGDGDAQSPSGVGVREALEAHQSERFALRFGKSQKLALKTAREVACYRDEEAVL